MLKIRYKNNHRNRLINYAIVLALSLSFFILPLIGQATESEQRQLIQDLENQIKIKQKKIAELQKQIDAHKEIIRNKKNEELTLKNQIDTLNSQIYRLELEIKIVQTQISETLLKIQESESKINFQESELIKQKEFLGCILRTIYEYDQETSIELILKNENFSDFLNQIKYIEELQNSVQEKIDKIIRIKKELENEKENLENQKKSLQEFQKNLQIRQKSFDNQRKEKKYLLNKTKGEEARYQRLLNELILQKSAFIKEIQKLENQVIAAKNFLIHVEAGKIPPPGTKIFIWPEDSFVLTQTYGMTNFAKKGAYGGAPHNGIDISGGLGTPIKAAAPGKILVKGYNKGWGNWVAIQHSNNLVTLYAHLREPCHLSNNTKVNINTVIGYEGNTGFSTGPHLHFSVYYNFFTYQKNGQLYFNYFEGTLNPLDYL